MLNYNLMNGVQSVKTAVTGSGERRSDADDVPPSIRGEHIVHVVTPSSPTSGSLLSLRQTIRIPYEASVFSFARRIFDGPTHNILATKATALPLETRHCRETKKDLNNEPHGVDVGPGTWEACTRF